MPDSLSNNPAQAPRILSSKEVLKGALTSGLVGLGLLILGLAAIVSVGVWGAASGTGSWAIAIGLCGVLLMLPSALVLGIGIQCVRLSMVGFYSLIVGKPVYVTSERQIDPDQGPQAEEGTKGRCGHPEDGHG